MATKKVNLKDSIYQQKNSGNGLNVKDGMLINNKEDGKTGIQIATQLNKHIKRSEKVSIYTDAIMIGNSLDSYFK